MMTLCGQMAELMPGLEWTRPSPCVAVGRANKREVVRVIRYADPDEPPQCLIVQLMGGDLHSGTLNSLDLAHAADTIRRQLREFRTVIDAALEETEA